MFCTLIDHLVFKKFNSFLCTLYLNNFILLRTLCTPVKGTSAHQKRCAYCANASNQIRGRAAHALC